MKKVSKKQDQNLFCPNCNKDNVFQYFKPFGKFNVYFCNSCRIGFTYPVPKNIGAYYNSNYWISPGGMGFVKNTVFGIFQRRRPNWIKKYLKTGDVLDVGAGEGNFAKNAPAIFNVLSIDSKTSKVQNPNVKKVDFLKWNSKRKFNAIAFWESLEHTANPQAYLKKASKLLKKNGLVFIEYPYFNSVEPKIFKKYWFHLDLPRHLSHLTDNGLSILLKRANFSVIEKGSVPAFEYSIWGFVASILAMFQIKPTDQIKGVQNLLIIIALLPVAFFAFLFEVIFWIFDQAPIGLIVARKK